MIPCGALLWVYIARFYQVWYLTDLAQERWTKHLESEQKLRHEKIISICIDSFSEIFCDRIMCDHELNTLTPERPERRGSNFKSIVFQRTSRLN